MSAGSIERPDGTEVAIEPIKPLPSGGSRIKIDVDVPRLSH